MARRFFKIKISEDAEIQVFIEIVSGLIVNFVVKLILTINSVQYEIIRFDSGHHCPHKDILGVDGEAARKIWFGFLGNKEALNLSIQDLKDNYELYPVRKPRCLQRG